jgi:hypothetical protein
MCAATNESVFTIYVYEIEIDRLNKVFSNNCAFDIDLSLGSPFDGYKTYSIYIMS